MYNLRQCGWQRISTHHTCMCTCTYTYTLIAIIACGAWPANHAASKPISWGTYCRTCMPTHVRVHITLHGNPTARRHFPVLSVVVSMYAFTKIATTPNNSPYIRHEHPACACARTCVCNFGSTHAIAPRPAAHTQTRELGNVTCGGWSMLFLFEYREKIANAGREKGKETRSGIAVGPLRYQRSLISKRSRISETPLREICIDLCNEKFRILQVKWNDYYIFILLYLHSTQILHQY